VITRAHVGVTLAATLATAVLVVAADSVSLSTVVLGSVGIGVVVALFVALRRRPELAGVVVIAGFALQPALKFFVSAYFGPAKDGVVILVVAAFLSRMPARRRELLGRDVVTAAFVSALLVLYLLNPAGSHDSAWSAETRLVIESFLLFGIGLAEPDAAGTARVAVSTLVFVGCGEAIYGLFQQAVGYAWLITHLGYTYGDQVRQSSTGNLRSFGTFDDAFSFGCFELLALVGSMRGRAMGGLSRRWIIPVLLSLGVIVSFVRTDWAILAALGVVALCRSVRRSAWVGLLGAGGVSALILVGVLSTTHVAASGTAGSESFIFSLNGRTLVWDKIVPTPSALFAGDGVGTFGSGLARAQLGSGIVQDPHYKAGQVVASSSVGAITSVDSSYFATLADVGLPGLLLLLGVPTLQDLPASDPPARPRGLDRSRFSLRHDGRLPDAVIADRVPIWGHLSVLGRRLGRQRPCGAAAPER
jgi:hypothetical protein